MSHGINTRRKVQPLKQHRFEREKIASVAKPSSRPATRLDLCCLGGAREEKSSDEWDPLLPDVPPGPSDIGSDRSVPGGTMSLLHQVPAIRTGTNIVEERRKQEGSDDVASSLAKWVFPMRRYLRLDPPTKLYFPYEPGKQVRSAVRITNISKCHVAFKFQTNAPKSCFMRPPGAVLSPKESIIAAVFKFLEHPEKNEKPLYQRCNLKFKILSLKVKGPMGYAPELFEEHKNQATIEQILQVVFVDPGSRKANPELEKVKHILAEAGAAFELPKKPPENAPNFL